MAGGVQAATGRAGFGGGRQTGGGRAARRAHPTRVDRRCGDRWRARRGSGCTPQPQPRGTPCPTARPAPGSRQSPQPHLGLGHLVVGGVEEVGRGVRAQDEGHALVQQRDGEHLAVLGVHLLHERHGALRGGWGLGPGWVSPAPPPPATSQAPATERAAAAGPPACAPRPPDACIALPDPPAHLAELHEAANKGNSFVHGRGLPAQGIAEHAEQHQTRHQHCRGNPDLAGQRQSLERRQHRRWVHGAATGCCRSQNGGTDQGECARSACRPIHDGAHSRRAPRWRGPARRP